MNDEKTEARDVIGAVIVFVIMTVGVVATCFAVHLFLGE